MGGTTADWGNCGCRRSLEESLGAVVQSFSLHTAGGDSQFPAWIRNLEVAMASGLSGVVVLALCVLLAPSVSGEFIFWILNGLFSLLLACCFVNYVFLAVAQPDSWLGWNRPMSGRCQSVTLALQPRSGLSFKVTIWCSNIVVVVFFKLTAG